MKFDKKDVVVVAEARYNRGHVRKLLIVLMACLVVGVLMATLIPTPWDYSAFIAPVVMVVIGVLYGVRMRKATKALVAEWEKEQGE